MLTFKEYYAYDDPLNIIFLCGSHYSPRNLRDKRSITKEYIETQHPNMRAIILEDNFQFANTNKRYLSYDDIFLNELAQIEKLASLYVNKIIIIHETVSTAAELGMFAINSILAQRICLLVPDEVSVEENKVGKFIELAFLRDEAPKSKVHLIRYYPDTEVSRTSVNKSEYYTFYHEDKIGSFLGNQLDEFILSDYSKRQIQFEWNQFARSTTCRQIIDYHVYSDEQFVKIWISADVLKIQLLSMLGLEDVRRELRTEKRIRDHVDYLLVYYNLIMRNTLEKIHGHDLSNYTIAASVKDSECNLKQAIGFFIYLLQAAKLIELVQTSKKIPTIRKVQLTGTLDKKISAISKYIDDTQPTAFGRAII